MLRVCGPRDSLEEIQFRAEEDDPLMHDGSLCLDHGILGGLPEECGIALREHRSVGVGGRSRDTGIESRLDLALLRGERQGLVTDDDLLVVGGRHVKREVGVDAGLVELLGLLCRHGWEDGAEAGLGRHVGRGRRGGGRGRIRGLVPPPREADLLALERELRGGQNILMEAPRRFGKTSLILEVKRRLEAAGIPVAYLDCMLVPSRARLADRLASAYLDAFKSPAQRAEDWVVQHLKAFRVRPTLTLDSEGHASLSFDAGSAGAPNLDALLEQIFQEPDVIAS